MLAGTVYAGEVKFLTPDWEKVADDPVAGVSFYVDKANILTTGQGEYDFVILRTFPDHPRMHGKEEYKSIADAMGSSCADFTQIKLYRTILFKEPMAQGAQISNVDKANNAPVTLNGSQASKDAVWRACGLKHLARYVEPVKTEQGMENHSTAQAQACANAAQIAAGPGPLPPQAPVHTGQESGLSAAMNSSGYAAAVGAYEQAMAQRNMVLRQAYARCIEGR